MLDEPGSQPNIAITMYRNAADSALTFNNQNGSQIRYQNRNMIYTTYNIIGYSIQAGSKLSPSLMCQTAQY